MAVTVTQQPFVMLDPADRIVEVGPHAESQFGPLVGSLIWDAFPGAKPLFKPYYDEARLTGETVDFVQFYDGNVVRVVARNDGHERLEVSWQQVARLDTTTLADLRASLATSLDLLEGEERLATRGELRSALRLIPGGAG